VSEGKDLVLVGAGGQPIEWALSRALVPAFPLVRCVTVDELRDGLPILDEHRAQSPCVVLVLEGSTGHSCMKLVMEARAWYPECSVPIVACGLMNGGNMMREWPILTFRGHAYVRLPCPLTAIIEAITRAQSLDEGDMGRVRGVVAAFIWRDAKHGAVQRICSADVDPGLVDQAIRSCSSVLECAPPPAQEKLAKLLEVFRRLQTCPPERRHAMLKKAVSLVGEIDLEFEGAKRSD